ncbi:MAG TPA: DUF427 domain-containing protein [Candidatus Acidoferrales bacterium]|nr:DUF427 domain-containing protein [Candidatus Acidoferrales bacterium]
MPKAIWKGVVIAESGQTVLLEGNHYFPPQSVRREYLRPSTTTTECPWKGAASYYHVEVNGERNADAAWYYPAPSAAARQIKDHVAFWKGVQVEA